MCKTMAHILLGITLSGTATAQQDLAFVGDFESGEIRPTEQKHDGFLIRTLPQPQAGSEIAASGSGGFGPNAAADTRVVHSEIVGTESVTPRKGAYFARSALYYKKNYLGLNADAGLDKPRSDLALTNPTHRFDYDVEGYLGFSIYVPLNYEHETGTKDTPGATQLLSVKEPQSASRGFFVLEQYVPSGGTQARWFFRFSTNATSTFQEGGVITKFDLGPVDNDRGKWTDFVIRFRENPFSVDTNPHARGIAGSKDQLYKGNRGIMQVWKAEGPVDGSGNRRMVSKVNVINKPLGLVPHATDLRSISLRIYKYGWKKNPTDVIGPVWFGFDEIRVGFSSDGAKYSDVNPSGLACTDACPDTEPAPVTKPTPPSSVDVT